MQDVALGATDGAPVHAVPRDSAGPVAEPRRSAEEAEQLVLDLIAAHADSLLRMARRYSVCADDAQDAYQRGLEILIRHSARLDAEGAAGWLHTVVKHEALSVNRARRQILGGDEVDLDTFEMRTAPSPEEQVIGFERVARSAEALQRLKPQEVRALWLKSMGNSYQEICEATGWTYTKVNRCLAEGRKSFLARYAGIEAGDECKRWAPVLSAMVDGEATSEQLMQLRPHLRNCAGCRATVRELRGSNAPLVALFPVGGLAFGGGVFGGAGDVVDRLWRSLWGDLGEKAAGTAVRVHAVMETVTSGRAAATVASVVTLAGGGLAIENALGGGASSARTAPPPASATPGGVPASAAAGRSPAATAAASASGGSSATAAATSGGSAGAGAPAAATVKFAATRIRQAATGTATRRAASRKAAKRAGRARPRAVVRRPSARRVVAAPATAVVRPVAPAAPVRSAALPAPAPARAAGIAARAASPAPARVAARPAAPSPLRSPSRPSAGEFSLERP